MTYSSQSLLNAVNQYLASHPVTRTPQSLYEPIDYVLSLGGKRIRPVLMLLSYNLYKDDPLSIMAPAIALETYHNYTLLHDDLMDNADVRRSHHILPYIESGMPTLPSCRATQCSCSPISV